MTSAQLSVDLQVGVVARRGVADEAVGSEQTAEAASVGRTGRSIVILVDHDARERTVPLQRLPQHAQHLTIVQMV